jgi:glycosyltransferase involved in cell wall biosynthesis
LIAPQPFYQDRGTPIAVCHVATALSQEGWHVDILTYPAGEDIDLPNVHLFRFARWLPIRDIPIGLSLKKLALDLVMIVAIWRKIRAENYACVHAVEEAIYPALLFARTKRLPVIYDMQSSLVEQLALSWARFFIPSKFAARCERMACEKAVLVVCSAGLAHSLISTDGSSTRAREWTFPTDAMQSVVDSSPLADQPLNLADTARLIIYTGNFAAYQGIDLLLSALPLVAAQCADAVFVLVGADSKSLRRLSARHAEEIRQGRLIVLARQSRARTLKLLQKADVAVSPRVSGTNLPLKVFDYLVAGLPVVATHIAAPRPLEGKGLLLTEATPAGLAGGIVDLLKDRSLMERYGARARAVADTELGWPLFRTQVAAIYHDALEQIRARTV